MPRPADSETRYHPGLDGIRAIAVAACCWLSPWSAVAARRPLALMPQAVLATSPLVRAGVQLALIILLSALSWAVLENPIRRHGLLGEPLAEVNRLDHEVDRQTGARRCLTAAVLCLTRQSPQASMASLN